MKTQNYFIGTNKEAVQAIIAMYMVSGDEDKFIKTIPQKRRISILNDIKNKDIYVYDNIKHYELWKMKSTK